MHYIFKNSIYNTQKELSQNTKKLYESKKYDRNFIQRIVTRDKYLHHHVGIGITTLKNYSNQIERTKDIQTLENNQAYFIINLLDIPQKKLVNIADLGCGRGGTMFIIADNYPDVHIEGVNITDYHVNFCMQYARTNTSISKQNYLETTFKEDQFDKIYCNEASEHTLDIKDLFKEVYRILKINGIFVLATWIYDENILEKNKTEYSTILKNINNHYQCNIHSIGEIENAYKLYNFYNKYQYDKSDEVENYWSIRKDWVFKSGIEEDFILGHRMHLIKYMIYVFIKQ